MGLNGVLSKLTIIKYAHKIKATPREIIFNRRLLLSAALYACAGIPISELSQLSDPFKDSYSCRFRSGSEGWHEEIC